MLPLYHHHHNVSSQSNKAHDVNCQKPNYIQFNSAFQSTEWEKHLYFNVKTKWMFLDFAHFGKKGKWKANLLMHTNINIKCKLNQWRLFHQNTVWCCNRKSMHIRTHIHTHTHRHTQRYEHMSWRTLNKATVTTTGVHTYSLGQRECDLQTLPLSRRRKMGQNNRNRLRCFLHQLSSSLHHTACFQLSQTARRDTQRWPT